MIRAESISLTERQLEVLRAVAEMEAHGRDPISTADVRNALSLGAVARKRLMRLLDLRLLDPKALGWRLTPSGREVLERMGGVK